MARIDIAGLSKRFGDHWVIPGVDLSIADGEFMVLVGPSGCGKSTLLRMLAGLEQASAGQILFDGQPVTEVAPADRGVAMVFQSYALYPHMTVAQNMAFALSMAGVGQAERRARVLQAAHKLQLQDLLERYPKELSGGQRQRVAIGRAIVRQPKVFLFDEPLSNLDAALRVHMRIELARLHADLRTTMVYVTHDQTEAMTLGHRIAVFNQGRIEQVGTPMALYRTPVNRFVAEFLGTPKINLWPYATGSAPACIEVGGQPLALPAAPADLLQRLARGACLGVRPESLRLDAPSPGIGGTIDFIENLGDVRIAYVRCPGLQDLVRVKLLHQADQFAAGQAVRCCPDFDQLHIFDPQGQAL